MKLVLTRSIRFLLAGVLSVALLIGALFVTPDSVHAASGGRIGGGNFRSTPTPSMPRGGGYRGGGYGGSYGRGGIGFPFLLPIFGFGGGGLFGFLILMAITGVIVNSFRGGGFSGLNTSDRFLEKKSSSVSMIQLQLGLLASAKQLQVDLRELASNSDTSSFIGLQKVLQETTLALLRQPDLWVYANLETGSVPFDSAESTFNRLSMIERSKLKEEVTFNVSGQLKSDSKTIAASGDAAMVNEYIAVTLIVAAKNSLAFKNSLSSEDLRDHLRIIGSIPSDDILALEVIWQPDRSGDVLSAEDLVTAYPNLKHL